MCCEENSHFNTKLHMKDVHISWFLYLPLCPVQTKCSFTSKMMCAKSISVKDGYSFWTGYMGNLCNNGVRQPHDILRSCALSSTVSYRNKIIRLLICITLLKGTKGNKTNPENSLFLSNFSFSHMSKAWKCADTRGNVSTVWE